MPPALDQYVTLVETLERTCPYEEFAPLIQATVRRLEEEGVRALVAMNFYAQPDSTDVGVVITFANRDQFVEHIRMISAWDEFKRFVSMVKLVDMRIYGQLSAEAEAWIQNFDPSVARKRYPQRLAGFVRQAAPAS